MTPVTTLKPDSSGKSELVVPVVGWVTRPAFGVCHDLRPWFGAQPAAFL